MEFVPHVAEGVTPYSVDCRYANGLEIVLRDSGWEGLGACAVRFEGEEGWVQTGDGGIVEASDSLKQYRKNFEDAREATTRHVRDFLNCVKSRKDARAQRPGGMSDACGLPCGIHRVPVGRVVGIRSGDRQFPRQ